MLAKKRLHIQPANRGLSVQLSRAEALQRENGNLRRGLSEAQQSLVKQVPLAFDHTEGAALEEDDPLEAVDCMLQLSDHASLALVAFEVCLCFSMLQCNNDKNALTKKAPTHYLQSSSTYYYSSSVCKT